MGQPYAVYGAVELLVLFIVEAVQHGALEEVAAAQLRNLHTHVPYGLALPQPVKEHAGRLVYPPGGVRGHVYLLLHAAAGEAAVPYAYGHDPAAVAGVP